METEDKILFEHLFPAEDMDNKERNESLYIISNLRDVANSEHFINENDPRRYSLVMMSLDKRNEAVHFNGGISNGVENRYIDGYIFRKKNSISVHYAVDRLHHETLDDNDYFMRDEFRCVKGVWKRNNEVLTDFVEPTVVEAFIDAELAKIKKIS